MKFHKVLALFAVVWTFCAGAAQAAFFGTFCPDEPCEPVSVPEIEPLAGIGAIVALASILALVWERRRRR